MENFFDHGFQHERDWHLTAKQMTFGIGRTRFVPTFRWLSDPTNCTMRERPWDVEGVVSKRICYYRQGACQLMRRAGLFPPKVMCGRYVSKIDADVERHFNLTKVAFEFSSYNVAPGRRVPVLRQGEGGDRELVLMRWGLVPHWAKEERIGYKMINARAETVASKPAYRQPFKRRRCLIPANGFYEWHKVGADKTPYFIHLKTDSIMGFAGLWDIWMNPAGERIESCTIVTTAANAVIQPLHDRMPLIVAPADYPTWLAGDAAAASELMSTPSSLQLDAYPVSKRVNKPQNDDPACIDRVA